MHNTVLSMQWMISDSSVVFVMLTLFAQIPKTNMVITSLDFHTDLTSSLDVDVWIRRGSHVGYERNQLAWEHVCDHVQIKGQGKCHHTIFLSICCINLTRLSCIDIHLKGPYKPTAITQGFQEVKLQSYERAAIYVTLSTPNIRYTKVDDGNINVGDIIYDLADLSVLAGSGIKGNDMTT